MVRSCHDDGIDVGPLHDPPEIARLEFGCLTGGRDDVLLCLGNLRFVDVAESNRLGVSGLEHVPKIRTAHSATAD